MTGLNLQRFVAMFRTDARLRLGIAGRHPVILLLIVPLIGFAGFGYYVFIAPRLPVEVFHIVPFFILLSISAPSFGSLLVYPRVFEFYVVSGTPLRDVLMAQNLNLFLLVGSGALVCGFGCQWAPSITLRHSISVFAYFMVIIFPLLIAFNYVAVFRRCFRAALLQMFVFSAVLFLASVPYLICWMYLESYLLCLLVVLLEVLLYVLALFRHIAPIAHRRGAEIVEIGNEMYPAR